MCEITDFKLEFLKKADFVEYYLFPLLPKELNENEKNKTFQEQNKETSDPSNFVELDKGTLRCQLDSVLKHCNKIIEEKVKEVNYIWHKDDFHLEIKTDDASDGNLLPPHLYGATHYGESIMDKWFIVRLLRELTLVTPGLVVLLVDESDKFLLKETVDVLPESSDSENCKKELYIFNGKMHFISNTNSNNSYLTVINDLRTNAIVNGATCDTRISALENNQEFEDKLSKHFCHQIVRLPITVATILKERPEFIAHAVSAFCKRDGNDMKACRSMRFFPPEQQRVRTNVRFTHCLYTMLMNSNYTPDDKIGWNLNSAASNAEEYKEDILGVKIACGFEILASQVKGTGDNNDDFQKFLQSISDKGYFHEYTEDSTKYEQLLKKAKAFFEQQHTWNKKMLAVGTEILALLKSTDLNTEALNEAQNNLKPTNEQRDSRTCFKQNGELNTKIDCLENRSLLNDLDSDGLTESGDEIESNHPRRKSHKQRRDEFRAKVKKNNSMRKACNQNSVIFNDKTRIQKDQRSNKNNAAEQNESNSTHVKDFLELVIPEDNWESNSEMSEYEDEVDIERNIEAMTSANIDIDLNIQPFICQMAKELPRNSIDKSSRNERKSNGNSRVRKASDDSFDDIESFEPININVNKLKNMMEIYKSSEPATHLINAMGVGMSTAVAKGSENDVEELKESAV